MSYYLYIQRVLPPADPDEDGGIGLGEWHSYIAEDPEFQRHDERILTAVWTSPGTEPEVRVFWFQNGKIVTNSFSDTGIRKLLAISSSLKAFVVTECGTNFSDPHVQEKHLQNGVFHHPFDIVRQSRETGTLLGKSGSAYRKRRRRGALS